MRIKYSIAILIFTTLFLPSILFSQITIKPKKVSYNRSGVDVPDNRKSFDVVYPIVKGRISSKATLNLRRAISYWTVFKTNLKETLTEDFWLTSLYYKINYNDRRILDISLFQEGVGAYPWTNQKNIVINLETGKPVKLCEIFYESSLNSLLSKVRKSFNAEVSQAIKNRKGWDGSFADSKYQMKDLNNFSITNKGITFNYDYNFPFAILADEPEGKFFFTFAQLKPFIRRDGLLGRFIR
jgi:hypothetical protein